MTADRVAAELVRRSMDAAVKFKSERPQPQQQTAGLKRKMTPAEKTQERKKRRQRQSQRRREKKEVEEKERAEEDRWHEMSCAFVEDAAMKKAVAWRERREVLRAWRGVRGWAREVERVEREAKVGWETKEPTKEQTTESEKPVEPVEHGGWCERLQWNDQLTQSSVEGSGEDELDWMEVQAAIAMMQKSATVVARNRTTVEQNPLFAATNDKMMVVGPVAASVASVGATEGVQRDTTEEKVAKAADAETVRDEKVKISEQIGDNRTDWRLIQYDGVSGIA